MNDHPPSWLLEACRAEYEEPEATRLARALWNRILLAWHEDGEASR